MVAPAQNHVHRVHWARPMQLAELQRALSVLSGIFRTVRVKSHAGSATQVHSAAAQASLLSAAAALQDRSPLVAPLRPRARPAPQANTAQLQALRRSTATALPALFLLDLLHPLPALLAHSVT